jgi:hypothetical protein
MGERRSNITGGAREAMHVSGDIRYTCGNDMVTAVDCLHIGQARRNLTWLWIRHPKRS